LVQPGQILQTISPAPDPKWVGRTRSLAACGQRRLRLTFSFPPCARKRSSFRSKVLSMNSKYAVATVRRLGRAISGMQNVECRMGGATAYGVRRIPPLCLRVVQRFQAVEKKRGIRRTPYASRDTAPDFRLPTLDRHRGVRTFCCSVFGLWTLHSDRAKARTHPMDLPVLASITLAYIPGNALRIRQTTTWGLRQPE